MKIELELTETEVEWIIDMNNGNGSSLQTHIDYPSYTVSKKLFAVVNPYDVQWLRLVNA